MIKLIHFDRKTKDKCKIIQEGVSLFDKGTFFESCVTITG
jgi:hypothetical protein